MDRAPIFIGGLDRSGKTYLRFMLSAHPNVILSRRTNLWTNHYNRYGSLEKPANLERCLSALAESKHIRALGIDFDQLRRDYVQGKRSYERLFEVLHEQYASNHGKSRWGDQSESLEKMAGVILSAFPHAKFLHMIRDPRDRYQAVLEKNRVSQRAMRLSLRRAGLGASTARWLTSAMLAQALQQRYPGSYKVVRYESLVTHPIETLREICDFIGEQYYPEMIAIRAEKRFANRQERDDGAPSPLSTDYIGRYRQHLSAFEIEFIQKRTQRLMAIFGYELDPVSSSGSAFTWLFSSASLLGWRMMEQGSR